MKINKLRIAIIKVFNVLSFKILIRVSQYYDIVKKIKTVTIKV